MLEGEFGGEDIVVFHPRQRALQQLIELGDSQQQLARHASICAFGHRMPPLGNGYPRRTPASVKIPAIILFTPSKGNIEFRFAYGYYVSAPKLVIFHL